MTCHFIFLVSYMHASYKTSSEMLNAEFISKRLRNMGEEVRFSAMENVQEKNSSERWRSNWPDWQICLRTWRFILEAHHPRQINRSLDHSSRLRAICHAELIAPIRDNQRPQLHLLSWRHLDLPTIQAAHGANLTDKRLTRTSPDGTPSPSPTLSYFQSW